MSDVARLAGVNRVTASVALNGSPRGGTRVSEATRQRVLKAARELGYTPSAIALALRNQRTNIIGFYTGHERLNTHDPFTATVLNSLQACCHKHRQDLLMFGSYERDSVEEIYASLSSGKIDGLIFLPSPRSPEMDQLLDSHLPVVAIANSVPNVVSVLVDDESGSHLLAQYLAQKGHRRVMYRADTDDHASTRCRQDAFIKTGKTLGMDIVVTHGDWEGNLQPEEIALLTSPPGLRPTAVACWLDLHAYFLLDQCPRLGLQVPRDLAVVGFDGILPRIRPAHSLTTIRAPWAAVAETAVDLLMALLNGEDVAQKTVFPVELVIGETA